MTTTPIAHRGRCPHCGAELAFHVGSSRSAVCEYCHTLVARRGQDYADLGLVAELIPTGTQLALGDTGRFESASFRVAGRLQYQWEQGAWDEWYLALDDGRWAWLSEAQGRYYILFKTAPRKVPSAALATPGGTVLIEGLGQYVITDIKEATIITAAGELPDEVTIGSAPYTADLEGQNGSFVTIDYGDGTEPPVLFAGKQVPLADLALVDTSGREVRQGEPRVATDKLKCPNCGAPIEIRVPGQTVRLVCESCNAMLDTSQGPLQLLGALERLKGTPPVALGSTGTLRGVEYVVVGFMARSCVVEGIRYAWEELLLYDPKTTGFSWLVRSDGHWQFAAPISAGEVHIARGAVYKGRRFRWFSRVTGRVDQVLGEFYWAVAVGDRAVLEDYIAPPEGLSRETTGTEVNWSHVSHLEAQEVADAFKTPPVLRRPPVGVGATQPYPHEAGIKSLNRFVAMAAVPFFLIAFAFMGQRPVTQYRLSQEELSQPDDATTPPDPNRRVHAYLSPPFELLSRKAVEVKFNSNVDNGWATATGAIIPAGGGDSAGFELESTRYSGVEGGEGWVEGDRETSDELSALPFGDYVLRADIEWDPRLKEPPDVTLTVAQGGQSFAQFFVVMLALALPLLLNLHRKSFEAQRWENSTSAN